MALSCLIIRYQKNSTCNFKIQLKEFTRYQWSCDIRQQLLALLYLYFQSNGNIKKNNRSILPGDLVPLDGTSVESVNRFVSVVGTDEKPGAVVD